jgi:pectin methylesterase-like acyl-CoA thioesterase
VKWADSLGTVLSTANPYNVTMDADKKITAVFDTVTTYSFNVNIAGSKWGEVQLTPQPTNGRYETGTIVTMKAIPNAVTNFNKWEDNSTTLQRVITVSGNQSFTATFNEIPFITGWNFKASTPTISRTGDLYSETTNIGMVSAYDPNGSPVSWTANTAMLSPSYPSIRFGTAAADFKTKHRYLRADFSTLNYRSIQITSFVSAVSQAYSVQLLQYSIDNVNFKEVARVDITDVYNSAWKPLNATLPAEAEGQKRVYIRWVADTTSTILGDPTSTDGTSFTNVFVYADKYTAVDTIAPVLISTEPANGSQTAPVNGTVVLNFNEPMKAGTGNITLGSTVLSGTFGSRTVSFNYQKLSYNSQYTITVPAGALTDLAGNPFPGITVTFNTSVRTQPTKKLFDAVVAQDGTGDYPSVLLAIAAAPINRTAPWLIYIKNGKYTGHIDILSIKPFIHLIGQNRDSVIISDNRLSGEDGDQTTLTFPVQQGATVYVNAPDCYFENLTIENSYGFEKQAGPQALALYTEGDRFTANNVWLRSYQDTYLTAYGGSTFRHYWRNSKIEGAVDFIYGGGDVFFDKCNITCVRKDGGYIVAPSHRPGTLWGYVFSHCTIDESHASGVTTYLGRPWANSPKTVFLYTTLKANVYPKGWHYKMNAIPAVFADYGTMDASGNMVDTSFRIEDYEYNKTDSSGNTITIKGKAKKSLTDEEAATYTYENVSIRNGSNWDPRLMTEAPEKPGKVLLKGSTVSWKDIPYSRLYIVFRDKKVLGFTTNATYTDASAVSGNTYTYAVQAVSEYGALSGITNAVDDTIPPVVKVKNIAVALDSSGKVSITADMVDNGSYDESGIDTLTIDKDHFDCPNIGDNQVTLTVTDKKGNVASAIAIVTVKDTTAPLAITQNVTIQLNADGKALIDATAINNGSYDACGIKSIVLSKTDFDCSNAGANTVTLTVTDNNDNVSTASAIVTVEDKISPVVRVKNVELNLVNGSALLNPSDLDNGSSDACGISSMTVSRTSFDCASIGDHTVTLTMTDRNGNSSSASATVTIKGVIPEPTIVVSRKDTTYTAVSSNTILLGYGAQSLTLTAIDKSSGELVRFNWSPATGLSSTTSANPEFKPTTAGTYTFHVEAFNSNGCSASASVIVNVVDVRCGDMKDKVLVCHYGQVICINSTDVYTHLAHGCKIGSCDGWTSAAASINQQAEKNNLETNKESGQNKIKVYPVPASGFLNVQFVSGEQVDYAVELYDLKGALIKIFDRGHVNRSTVYTRRFDISRLPAGAYMLRLSMNKEISTKTIIIK